MDSNSFFGLNDIKRIIKNKIKIVILLTVVGALLGAGLFYMKFEKVYTANATVVIGNIEGSTNREKNELVQMYQRMLRSSYFLLKSDVILNEAQQNLGENFKGLNLKEIVDADYRADTQLMTITAIGSTPENAKKIVDEVSKVFVVKSNEVFDNINMELIEESKLPQKIESKGYKKLILLSIIGAIAGFIGGSVLGLLLEAFDTRIKDERDVKTNLELPVLGFIPENK